MPGASSVSRGSRVRRVRAGECEALIGFIATLNQPGMQHCLHFASTEAGIRADVDKGGIDLTLSFWLADAASGWRGAVGVMRDADQGWLYGPWALDEGDGPVRTALLGVAMAPPDLSSLQAFTDVRSTALVAELRAAGFESQHEVQVMRATRERWQAATPLPTRMPARPDIGRALPMESRAIAALHDAVLPHAGLSGRDMLQYASRAGLVLAARDAQGRVLGSLCLALDPALREAELEFLAVWPQARGQGVGKALLLAALDEALGARRYEAVNLCVDGANANALGLYTASGFERRVTGIKQCWSRRGR